MTSVRIETVELNQWVCDLCEKSGYLTESRMAVEAAAAAHEEAHPNNEPEDG